MKYIVGAILFGVGLICGILISRYTLDASVEPALTETAAEIGEITDSVFAENITSEQHLEKLSSIEKSNKKLDRKVDLLSDSLSRLSAEIDSLRLAGDSTFMFSSDSLQLTFDSMHVDDEEVVLIEREQKLSTTVMEIIWIAKEAEATDPLVDTLKSELNITESSSDFMNVELWKSPLGYRGYKLSKSNLVLYGLLDEGILNLYEYEGAYYLQTTATVYKMEPTSELKAFIVSEIPSP